MDLPDAIDFVRPSIVQVAALIAEEHRAIVLGTGFLIHTQGFALTARHVTRAAQRFGANTQIVVNLALPNIENERFQLRASFSVVHCELVEEDPRHDLALLKLHPNPVAAGGSTGMHVGPGSVTIGAMSGVAEADKRRPRDGEPVAVSGYPLAHPVLITTSGAIASAWATEIAELHPPGTLAGFAIPDRQDSYIADVAVNPGNSGGPAYRVRDGRVLGVCVAFQPAEARIGEAEDLFRYNSGLCIIVPIQYGLALLHRHAPV